MSGDRALRNNNPGNLRIGPSWQGLMPPAQMTPKQAAEKDFAVFQSASWGFRALALTLIAYQNKHNINTIRGIIKRFAPPNENNTAAYIAAVAYGSNHGADDPLDLSNPDILRPICKAIAIHESGAWVFLDSDLVSGIQMAEAVS